MTVAPQQEMKRFLPPGPIRSESKIYGLGEMAELTRAYNWGNSAVGPIETWPEVLLTTVNTLLNSRHPMFLWWGDDLIQFYNDAYRPSCRVTTKPGNFEVFRSNDGDSTPLHLESPTPGCS